MSQQPADTATSTTSALAPWVLTGFAVVLGLGLMFGAPYLFGGASKLERLGQEARGELAEFEVFEDYRTLPERPLISATGDTISTADFTGKLYLINFWATWCAPCREEMPTLSALQARFDPEQFEVVLVSLDRQGFEVATPFLTSVGVDHLRSLLDRTNRLTLELGGSGLPITILVDAKGRWVGRMDGPADWAGDDAVRMIETALAVL